VEDVIFGWLRALFGGHACVRWQPFWLRGDVWIECVVCGSRRRPPSEDFNLMLTWDIAPQSRFPRKTDVLL
jgi:hypothetical protein